MSDWEHVDKEEIIISEEGLDEAVHNAYLKGKREVLDKIRAEIIARHLKNIEHDDYSNGYSVALEEILSFNVLTKSLYFQNIGSL